MDKIKKFIKKLVPPIFLDLKRFVVPNISVEHELLWIGPYSSWDEASQNCTGYDQSNILERCKESLLKVKNGKAVYERDSVIFDEIQYSWPVLASLQKAALENKGELKVLDFGGSLGSSYFQNKAFLESVDLTWCIVEQEHFVSSGKEFFEDNSLRFYDTVETCLVENKINVVLLSSVLQYIPDPYDLIKEIVSFDIPYIILDRTAVTELEVDFIAVQQVPESIYHASYPCWFISEPNLKSIINDKYTIISDFESICDGPTQKINNIEVSWKGYFLKIQPK